MIKAIEVKMESLVPDYDSNSRESDDVKPTVSNLLENGAPRTTFTGLFGKKEPVVKQELEDKIDLKTEKSLDSDSSTSNSGSNFFFRGDVKEEINNQSPVKAVQLANPFKISFGRGCTMPTIPPAESVFQIGFREEENRKEAALEHHVKMTPAFKAAKLINGKKICWNYRKGRCRFGPNCVFAHDSDVVRPSEEQQKANPAPDTSTESTSGNANTEASTSVSIKENQVAPKKPEKPIPIDGKSVIFSAPLLSGSKPTKTKSSEQESNDVVHSDNEKKRKWNWGNKNQPPAKKTGFSGTKH